MLKALFRAARATLFHYSAQSRRLPHLPLESRISTEFIVFHIL
jgi:hypothetical protein